MSDMKQDNEYNDMVNTNMDNMMTHKLTTCKQIKHKVWEGKREEVKRGDGDREND